jgi:hypothetical protein
VRLIDFLVIGGAGLIGFGLVSWVINVVRQQRAPPVVLGTGARAQPSLPPPQLPRSRLSLAELASRWHVILGVPPEAGSAQIEAAYRQRAAESGRDPAARSDIEEAYQFIRTLRQSQAPS